MNKIFKAIKEAAGKGANVQKLILAEVKARKETGYAAIIEAADAIDAAYPVVKGEDGKDENREARNNLLSILRVQMNRAGKAEGMAGLTVKKVEGAWQVIEKAATEPAQDDASGAEGGEPGEGGGQDDEAAQERLWEAVELVLANLGNAAVLHALRDGITKMAQG